MALTRLNNRSLAANAAITADKLSVGPLAGMRNRIINGDFRVAQRGTPFTNVVMSGATSLYNFDRWCTGVANVGDTGACTISQATGGIRYEVTTADASLTSGSATSLRQIIEGYNCADLAGTVFTVSFKMKTNKIGNYGVFVYDYTGSSYRTPQSITVTSANTIESYTLTFPALPAITNDNAARMGLNIVLAAASNRAGTWYPTGGSQVNLFDAIGNYVEIYDVQLEPGSIATEFERRPYGVELMLCQRYYQTWFRAASDNQYLRSPYVSSAPNSSAAAYYAFPTTMRVAPTMTYSASFSLNRFTSSVDGASAQIGSSSGATAYSLDNYYANAEL